MAYNPVVITPRAFDQGRDEGALRRTRRAADAYGQAGKDDAAAAAVFQTDPALSERYRDRGQRTADETYQRDVAPLIAREDYQGALDLSGVRGRPMQDILNIREQMRSANEEQVRALNREMEQQARTLLGISEMDGAGQQAAYTQWRASLPAAAQANVPEQYSADFVRLRMRQAMSIAQIVAAEAQQRNIDLTTARLDETQRHNQAMEATAAARAANGGRASVLAGAEQRGRIMLSYPSIVQSLRDMDQLELQAGGGRARANPYNANRGNFAAGTVRDIPGMGNGAASMLGDDTLDSYRTAASTFEQSILPAFAGSAVTMSEAQRFVRANIPALNDSAAVLAQKSRNRQMITNQAAVIIGAEPPFPAAGFWQPSGVTFSAGGGGASPGDIDGSSETGVPTINSQAEYDALPSGAEYYDSEGNYAVKP